MKGNEQAGETYSLLSAESKTMLRQGKKELSRADLQSIKCRVKDRSRYGRNK
jgi:hypothetical protein